MTLLQTMAVCRPPPPFETHECVHAFVVDQTYARTGGCGTGSSKYRAVEALDSNGERRREERLVYMNGFARAVPTFVISDTARLLLENWGPYTQSFYDRVVPVLQPDRLQTVMDDLLCRSVGLLSATTGNVVDTMDVVRLPGYPPSVASSGTCEAQMCETAGRGSGSGRWPRAEVEERAWQLPRAGGRTLKGISGTICFTSE